MTAEIVKFPYSASRRVHSKKPRRSKNGTPEERAALAASMQSAPADVVLLSDRSAAPEEPAIDRRKLRGNPVRDHVATISFGATVCGKLYTMDLRGESLADTPYETRIEWLGILSRATDAMEKLSGGLAQAKEALCNCITGREFAAFVATLPLDDQAFTSAKLRELIAKKQSETSDFPVNLPVHDLGQPVLNLATEHDQ